MIPPFNMGFPHSSVGKESTCNSGDPGLIPVSGNPLGKDMLLTTVFLGFPCDSAGKESACNLGDLGSLPGLGDPWEKGMAIGKTLILIKSGNYLRFSPSSWES